MTVGATAVRRRPKDRKQQIMVHARDLFVELGYPNVSMAMIAGRVGITAGGLYRHYATKADLLEAVVRDAFDGVAPPPAGMPLEEVIDRSIAAALGHPHLADLWSREVRYLPDGVQREIRAVMRRAAQGYVPPLRARRPALSSEQAELIAWSIQSVLTCLARDSVRLPASGGQALVRGAARELLDVRLDLGAARPEAARRQARRAPVSTRERVLIAATRQFAAHGYQETSMASIGAEADVTGQNLYGYFGSKADLLRAVIVRGTHALWLELDAALEAAGDPAAALASVVAGYVRIARHWAGLRLDLVGDPELAEESRPAQREYVAEWVALVRQVRPELSQPEGRALVQMALAAISDLGRTPHLAQLPGFAASVTAVAETILTSAPATPAAPAPLARSTSSSP
jgi:AcrR family transcriptional regulator